MPYPVPPPQPPAVVHLQPQADLRQLPARPAAIAQSIAAPTAEVHPQRCSAASPCPSPSAASEATPAAPTLSNAGLLGTPINATVTAFPPETSTAAEAGAVEQYSTKALPELQSVQPAEPAAPQSDRPGASAATKPLPDLDQLAQSESGLAQLPDLAQAADTPTGQAAPSPAETLPAEPTSPSSPATPAAPADTPGSTPSPTPGPAPGGQILTIPDSLPPTAPAAPPQPPAAPAQRPAGTRRLPPIDRALEEQVLELKADRQEYYDREQVFVARGNVFLRFRGAVLTSDTLRVNVPDRIAVGEGNATLTRGQQILRGNRFEYNFVQQAGTVYGARGELFLPATGQDFAPTLPTDVSAGTITNQPLSARATAAQPLQVSGSPGGFSFGFGTGNQIGSSGVTAGQVNRIRFEAERADFSGSDLLATNVRLTNDPYSPPELEVRSPQVTYTRETPTRSVIEARNPRIVFDQGFSLPLLVNRIVIDRRRRNPGLFQIGYDETDRGGFYIQRAFNIFSNDAFSFSVTPLLLIQRGIDRGFDNGSAYGLVASLEAQPTKTTSIVGNLVFNSLNPDDFENTFRASVRARQLIGTHTLSLEYSYRDRLFNGSLGFQNVQSSLGLVVTSPTIALGTSGVYLSYQAGVQLIDADTDRLDLLAPVRTNNRVELTRYQTSAALSRFTYLWIGKPLPATPTQGLRYTPNPLVPYVALVNGLRGVFSGYSSGDTQAELTGSIGLLAQFGHFSRPFLDYTALNLSYSKTLLSGQSPFLFDRNVDQQVVGLGISQQLYGPIRLGVQTSINLDTGQTIDTNYTLEYARRTYTFALTYSPVRQAAALTFRINDFNWSGDPGPFSGIGASSVSGGVTRPND